MTEVERLQVNIQTLDRLMSQPPRHQEPVLFDEIIPMVKEISEGVLAILREIADVSQEEQDAPTPQTVQISVSLYTELMQLLQTTVISSAQKEVRLGATRTLLLLQSEIDGISVEEAYNAMVGLAENPAQKEILSEVFQEPANAQPPTPPTNTTDKPQDAAPPQEQRGA